MGSETTYDVFLSYNSLDRPAVLHVADELEKRGCSCFLDRWYLQPGHDWVRALETALAASRSAALFIGPHEMGRWQQKERAWVLDRNAEEPRFPVVPVLLTGCEPPLGFLKQLMWIDLRNGSPASEQLDALAAAIGGQDTQAIAGKQPRATVCPYRGLLAFREEDAEFFFGRQKYIDDLISKVAHHRLVAVVGSSGSGKSSVVRAGLVPQLRSSRETIWEIATMVPAEQPVKSLLNVLAPMLWPDVSDVVDLRVRANEKAKSLAENNLSLADLVQIVLEQQRGSQRLLLVVDQWEELYTQCEDSSEREQFIEQLLQATARDSSPLSVVLAVRSDFYSELLQHRPLLDRLEDAKLDLGPMRPEELRAAIEQPAKNVGLRFQDGLVDRLLDDAREEPGRLPLLEFALEELWKRQEAGALTHAAYQDLGRLSGAIAKRAEDIYEKLDRAAQTVMPGLFRRLVRAGAKTEEDTRRRADFRSLDETSQRVVRRLADPDARLLVTSRQAGPATQPAEQNPSDEAHSPPDSPGAAEGVTQDVDTHIQDTAGETVEVAHEELLRRWDRLTGWIDADRKFLQWRSRLVPHLEQYKRDRSLLQAGALREARQFYPSRQDELEDDERELVRISLTTARNRKLVLGGSVAALACVLMIIYVWVTANQRVDNLVAASPEGFEYTVQQLQLYRPLVVGRLHEAWANDELDEVQRRQTACALARFGALTEAELQYLLDEIPNAKPEEYRNYINALAAVTESVNLDAKLLELTTDSDSRAAKRRYASTAISLCSTDPAKTAPAKLMAALDEDPSDRTELIHHLWTDWAPDLEVLLPLMNWQRTSDAFCSAMCCALGRLDEKPATLREQVVPVLKMLHQDAAGGGTHSASAWALRQWRESPSVDSSKEVPPDQKWEVRKTGKSEMTFVLVPPGSFKMGSKQNQSGDEMLHEVQISREFWLSDREVRAALFADVLSRKNAGAAQTDNGSELPVFEVSWFDAVEFCNELSKEHDFDKPYYRLKRDEEGQIIEATVNPLGANGYRLPTEAEWEYACRAKSGTIFCYGDDDLHSPGLLKEYAIFYPSRPAITGSKLPNGWGLFDMHGNAWEWCQDWYKEDYYEESLMKDPPGPPTGSLRVFRGGSWNDWAGICRSANRSWYSPGSRSYYLGFRVARSPSGKPADKSSGAGSGGGPDESRGAGETSSVKP